MFSVAFVNKRRFLHVFLNNLSQSKETTKNDGRWPVYNKK